MHAFSDCFKFLLSGVGCQAQSRDDLRERGPRASSVRIQYTSSGDPVEGEKELSKMAKD
ncbi:hypothetical protein LguiA_021401 [Lonicera macranthoides]